MYNKNHVIFLLQLHGPYPARKRLFNDLLSSFFTSLIWVYSGLITFSEYYPINKSQIPLFTYSIIWFIEWDTLFFKIQQIAQNELFLRKKQKYGALVFFNNLGFIRFQLRCAWIWILIMVSWILKKIRIKGSKRGEIRKKGIFCPFLLLICVFIDPRASICSCKSDKKKFILCSSFLNSSIIGKQSRIADIALVIRFRLLIFLIPICLNLSPENYALPMFFPRV